MALRFWSTLANNRKPFISRITAQRDWSLNITYNSTGDQHIQRGSLYSLICLTSPTFHYNAAWLQIQSFQFPSVVSVRSYCVSGCHLPYQNLLCFRLGSVEWKAAVFYPSVCDVSEELSQAGFCGVSEKAPGFWPVEHIHFHWPSINT